MFECVLGQEPLAGSVSLLDLTSHYSGEEICGSIIPVHLALSLGHIAGDYGELPGTDPPAVSVDAAMFQDLGCELEVDRSVTSAWTCPSS